MDKGKVYFVGAGPGESELITVKGLNLLKGADVVIYDYLVNSNLLNFARPDAKLTCCDALGKGYRDGFLVSQGRINRLMMSEAKKKRTVLRLKNGDPLIFGRLSQEMEFLAQHNIPFEVVPGVTAASGAAAYSGIALTDRRYASTVTFVTGHEAQGKKASSIAWQSLSQKGTLVFYMGVENLKDITSRLIAFGRSPDEPCMVIENATLPNQREISGRLKDITGMARRNKIHPPAVVIVGEVTRYIKGQAHFKGRPRILWTGIEPSGFSLRDRLIHQPLIEIRPLDDYSEVDAHIRQLENYDWLIFTSRFGVKYFFERLKYLKRDSRNLFGLKIAAIGQTTAGALEGYGLRADCIPQDQTSLGLVEALKRFDLMGSRLIHFGSTLSTDVLRRALEALGAKFTRVAVYKNCPAKVKRINLNEVDEVVFTSGSTVRNFLKVYGGAPRGMSIKCIGRPTLEIARRAGLKGRLLEYGDKIRP